MNQGTFQHHLVHDNNGSSGTKYCVLSFCFCTLLLFVFDVAVMGGSNSGHLWLKTTSVLGAIQNPDSARAIRSIDVLLAEYRQRHPKGSLQGTDSRLFECHQSTEKSESGKEKGAKDVFITKRNVTKSYSESCAPRTPPFDAAPLRNSSFIFVNETLVKEEKQRWMFVGKQHAEEKVRGSFSPKQGNASYLSQHSEKAGGKKKRKSSPVLAVCFSGERRRLKYNGPVLLSNILRANDPHGVHAYASTWSYPDDTRGINYEEMEYNYLDLAVQFPKYLIAVRVQQLHPAMASWSHFGFGNGALMFYLNEACIRLVEEGPFFYQFVMRVRMDVRPIVPIVLKPSVEIVKGEKEEDWVWGELQEKRTMAVQPPHYLYSLFLTVGNTVYKILPTDATAIQKQKRIKDARQTDNPVVDSTKMARRQKKKDRSSFSSLPLFIHHYTLCCMNDWMAIGPYESMIHYGFLYSFVMQAQNEVVDQSNADDHSEARRLIHDGEYYQMEAAAKDILHQRVCWTPEVCLQKVLRLHGIDWVVGNMHVKLRRGYNKQNINRTEQSCPKVCRYLRPSGE